MHMIKANDCGLVVTIHTLVIQLRLHFILLHLFGDLMGKNSFLICFCNMGSVILWFGQMGIFIKISFCFRYMAPAPPPYDPYAGYPVTPVPMPSPAPVAAPSSYVPVQVIVTFIISNACIQCLEIPSFPLVLVSLQSYFPASCYYYFSIYYCCYKFW